MLFNSAHFLCFFPIVAIIYFVIPDRIKYIWLLISSYYFYMCWNAKYVLLLLFSTFITYLCALVIQKINDSRTGDGKEKKSKNAILAICLILNLGLLFIFKYAAYTLSLITAVFSKAGMVFDAPHIDLLLPVGISFYTFQALGYTIDVYRGDTKAERNFLRYALFVSFFPQLVAGPIERSGKLLGQLAIPHRFDLIRAENGFMLALWGYFLKLVIADRIAIFVDVVYGDPSAYPGVYLIVASLFFALQIYCDFAGYSLIAIGTAGILGIELMENFDAPYLAVNVAGFWRRWHISLTSWFRDYLYIPLGGNRKGKIRKQINKVIVFLLSGIWHGAGLTYAIWGLLNGLYQVAGEILMPLRDRMVRVFKINRESVLYRLSAGIVTFILVDISWIFFRADGLSDAIFIIRSILSDHNMSALTDGSIFNCGLDCANFILLILSILILTLADMCKCRGICIREKILGRNIWIRSLAVALMITAILIFGIWGTGYNENSFIYFQF